MALRKVGTLKLLDFKQPLCGLFLVFFRYPIRSV